MALTPAQRQARYEATPRGRFAAYKGNAKNRGYSFTLTFEQFVSYWRKPCWYCGYRIKRIGLDRIVNSRGYEPGNVRPACALCNRAKANMTAARFLALCSNVVRTHGLTYARI